MYQSAFRHHQQTRQFTIRYTERFGWEVIDQTDARIVRRAVYKDWHRVERALALIRTEEEALEKRGWQKTA